MKKSKPLPLRSLELHSQPRSRRAIAWSSDAELAVAADDSVTVFLPEYPLMDPNYDDEKDDHVFLAQQDGGSLALPAGRVGENGMEILPEGLMSHSMEGEDKNDDVLWSSEEESEEQGEDEEGDGGGGELGDFMIGSDGALNTDGATAQKKPLNKRHQFDDMTRQFTISYPALSPDLNVHIWEAAGKHMPVIPVNKIDAQDGDTGYLTEAMQRTEKPEDEEPEDGPSDADDQDGDGDQADDEQGDVDEEDSEPEQKQKKPPGPEVNPHPGAGTGLLGGTGSSLNHVVAVEWSPPDVGRNFKPVLAVLTSVGSLAIYGDGAHLPFGSTKKPWRIGGKSGGTMRDLQSWVALWAVGENFVVPGQEQYGYGEFVEAFSWCRSIGAGRALLAYKNDARELVVLSVGTKFRKTEECLDEAVWKVQEVLRMPIQGPHGELDPHDPDFVPNGSSYCLRWGPWVKGVDAWSCLLSYMDRNYVGFKKITINVADWNPVVGPSITCGLQDWDGQCHHLAADAFLEFENMVWDVAGKTFCRGVIATPLRLEFFQVDLDSSNKPPMSAHSTETCNTTFPVGSYTNPITGLVVHPVGLDVDATSPPIVPFYTAVRLSATHSNNDWWESNLPRRPNGGEAPQWVDEIQAKVNITMPFVQAGRIIRDTDRQDGTTKQEEDGGENDRAASDDDDDDDSVDSQASWDPYVNDGPEVHPWHMRLWGIAMSPAGGATAVIATAQAAVRPERASWSSRRSRVLFESKEPGEPRKKPEGPGPDAMALDRRNGDGEKLNGALEGQEQEEYSTLDVLGLSVEARLWEWMYGGGPGITGLTPSPPKREGRLSRKGSSDPLRASMEAAELGAQASRDKIKGFFASFVPGQTCVICADGKAELSPVRIFKPAPSSSDDIIASGNSKRNGNADGKGEAGSERIERRHLNCQCAQGHRYAICGISGLGILEPGISRACGVCHARSLTVDVLVDRWLAPAGMHEEAQLVRRSLAVDVCPRCGGKWLE